jgi:hypothetical protein
VLNGEHLETFSETGFASVPFSKGTHDNGMVNNEGRLLNTLRLKEVSNEFVNQTGRRSRVGALTVKLFAQSIEERASFFSVELIISREGVEILSLFSHLFNFFFESLHHGDAVKRRSEINSNLFFRSIGIRVILEFVRALNAEHHFGE